MTVPNASSALQQRTRLTWLMVLLAVVVPTVSVAALTPQVVTTGNVSHWPWEQHGFWGWWLVPAGLWLSLVPATARARLTQGSSARRYLWVVFLLALAAGTTLALLYNP